VHGFVLDRRLLSLSGGSCHAWHADQFGVSCVCGMASRSWKACVPGGADRRSSEFNVEAASAPASLTTPPTAAAGVRSDVFGGPTARNEEHCMFRIQRRLIKHVRGIAGYNV
jgi:hypothetical protein